MRTHRTIVKWVFTVFLMAGAFAIAAPVSRVTNFVDGQPLTASQLNGEFNNVIGGVNSINNAQIATNAQIAPSKIAATIKGDAIERNGSTGALSVKTDNVTVEISGDNIQLKDDGVTLAKMANDSVGTDQLVDEAVTTDKIDDGAVTQAKRAALGQQISSTSGAFGNSGSLSASGAVTNLSVTITTTGRPVKLELISDGSGNACYFNLGALNNTYGGLVFNRDSTEISRNEIGLRIDGGSGGNDLRVPCSSFSHIDVPSSGTYTYTVRYYRPGFSGISVYYAKLVAYEL